MLVGFGKKKIGPIVAKLQPAIAALGEKTANDTVVYVAGGKCFPLMNPKKKTPFVRVYDTNEEGRQASVDEVYEAVCEALKKDTELSELQILKDFREKQNS